jgi:hypothetical protein
MKKLLALPVALLIGISASGCGEKCKNESISVIASPDGKTKAVVFHRNCGANTAPNTQVSVLPAYSELPNIQGNALVLDADAPVEVKWVSDSMLSISGLGAARVSHQLEETNGVSIAYPK